MISGAGEFSELSHQDVRRIEEMDQDEGAMKSQTS